MFRLIYSVFMAVWRDSFGKDGWGLPVYKNRFVQHALAFLMTFLLCFFVRGNIWFVSLWIAFWIQIEWALGHGCCYDLGRGGKPDKKMIQRYEKMIGCKLLYKIFPEDEWYGFGFDFCLLAIRYTIPLLPICAYFNPVFLSLGLVITGLYALYRYCPYMQTKRWLDVEIWAGLALGLFVAYL